MKVAEMDLNQYLQSRFRVWLGLVISALVFVRVAFLFGAKLYFGAAFEQTDLILGVMGIGGGMVAFLYLKKLLRPKEKVQDV